MRNIAIIPARSGSKGLPDKNIKELAGKPLIAYSIEAAIKSQMFQTVMVSTDSEKYAEIAREYGAEVPFLRSEKTSSDTASSWDAVAEVLDNYHKLNSDYDTLMLLQPTSPLRTELNIREAYNMMDEKKACSIVSLCEMDHSPLQSNTLPESMSLDGFIRADSKGKRRQDMETYYRFNGAIYLTKVDFFTANHDIYRENCYAYIMSKRDSIDIDDEYDFAMAEAILMIKNGMQK
ncbi:MAG: acylneuraminate cytidylyltransferase family protein [Clostridiales bacterium]|nr:acylneuraminate cytidylyltransferase family protein [Clostridiales bacterium]